DWDGTTNGKPVPEGAYFYFLKTEMEGDKTGVINIVR
ncbi:MAG: gliding motility-associated C-terminal domain-containing protein, partial [Bacteroidetes bacterium]|nr:gliding motility-associated C-terminal domain-containing protein [Bacteroidota bacterium]